MTAAICKRALSRVVLRSALITHQSSSFSSASGKLPKKMSLPGVDKVILVSSAKGGVGKSSISFNLAIALQQTTRSKVGILDADVFGPSLPTLSNLHGVEPKLSSNDLIIPLTNFDLKCMSMGFLIDEKSPAVWRGLMVMSAIQKMLFGVKWGPLDYLIIDMPPGTGDTQLSVSQLINVSGAIIVTTPQRLSVIDATKGIGMFQKVGIPILGVVSNMTHIACQTCGNKDEVFGDDSYIKDMLSNTQSRLLTSLPIDKDFLRGCDDGKPLIIEQPNSKMAKLMRELAETVVTHVRAT